MMDTLKKSCIYETTVAQEFPVQAGREQMKSIRLDKGKVR